MSIAIPPENGTDEGFSQRKKKQIGKWILFTSLIIVYTTVYFIVLNLEQFTELKNWIKFLIYSFGLVIFFGPFIPIKNRRGKRVSILNSLVRLIEGPKKRRYEPKPQSNLNIEYKPPLISSCKCGFLLTRQMAKCPNCKRVNKYYYPKD